MCEYCKLPDSLAFADFEIDHVIARAHGGSSAIGNLAWSCLLCNMNEGPNLASIDNATGNVSKLFHPRLNRWSFHLRLSEGLIIPRTAAGPRNTFAAENEFAADFQPAACLRAIGS
jgi:hypothetical protein